LILRSSSIPFFALTADVKEAHRQVRVAPQDVPLQACQLEPGGDVYLNLVGTYGVASAGYWWGRLGAALSRLVYATLGGGDLLLWLLLFADDWLLFSGGKLWNEGLVLPIFLLRVLGVPFSWKKFSSGMIVSWIGLEVNLREWSLGLSARRTAWLTNWISKTLDAEDVSISELTQAVGRFQFAFAVLVWDRPFLAPLYSVIGAFSPNSRAVLPEFARASLRWIHDRLLVRRTIPCHVAGGLPSRTFRVDAKAEGNDVVIGGWLPALSPDGEIVKEKSKWFAVSLNPTSAPWAFDRGLPFKVISALELLATVVSLMLFFPAGSLRHDCSALVTVSGSTDSLVATHVLGRAMTTSFPLCLVAMEAAIQMERLGLDLRLAWTPRDLNSEADALSNFKFSGFDPNLRVHADMATLPFEVLGKWSKDARRFYLEEKPEAAKHRKVEGRTAARLGERLRDTDPW